jgi:hypothetical protein
MSVRKNNFGRRVSAKGNPPADSAALTRDQLKRQPAGAPFHFAPGTTQWTCACGGVNPIRHAQCRWCQEQRS